MDGLTMCKSLAATIEVTSGEAAWRYEGDGWTVATGKWRPKEAAPEAAQAASPAPASSVFSGAAARQGRSEAALVSGVPRRPWAPVPAPDSMGSPPAATETSPSVATPKSPVSVPKAAWQLPVSLVGKNKVARRP
eukprot:s200_g1.t1